MTDTQEKIQDNAPDTLEDLKNIIDNLEKSLTAKFDHSLEEFEKDQQECIITEITKQNQELLKKVDNLEKDKRISSSEVSRTPKPQTAMKSSTFRRF